MFYYSNYFKFNEINNHISYQWNNNLDEVQSVNIRLTPDITQNIQCVKLRLGICRFLQKKKANLKKKNTQQQN